MNRRRISALALLLLPLSLSPARAEDGAAEPSGGETFFETQKGPWQFGLDLGMAVPTRKKSFSQVVDNQRAYDLLAGETVGDEVGEGWVPPPAGFSTVAGTMKPMGDVGAHLFYWWKPWLAFGFEGGYGLKRDMRLDDRGIYVRNNFLDVAYSADIIHFSAPVKAGPTFGPFRPYVTAAPGVYWLQERASIIFTDPDDPQLAPLEILHKDRLCAGVSGGAGFEWRKDRGLIALDFTYHKIFSGSDHADFVEPRLRFSVLF